MVTGSNTSSSLTKYHKEIPHTYTLLFSQFLLNCSFRQVRKIDANYSDNNIGQYFYALTYSIQPSPCMFFYPEYQFLWPYLHKNKSLWNDNPLPRTTPTNKSIIHMKTSTKDKTISNNRPIHHTHHTRPTFDEFQLVL